MKHDLTTRKYERRARKLYALFSCLVLALTVMVVPAFAADDPLTVVNNLSEFIFSLIRAIGLILLGFGVLQLGLSLKSHDPSQRANGMLTIAGGIVITFTKESCKQKSIAEIKKSRKNCATEKRHDKTSWRKSFASRDKASI